jgi:isopenicillin N synthase-like dioxygenase
VQNISGEWISIDPIPDTFVVNIGDVLEVLTKGLYKSTLHRARNYSRMSRFALPYFYDVNWYAELKDLDIKISDSEQRIIDRVKSIERWDKAQLHEVKGIFGHYYCKKIMAEFPYTLRKKV